LKFSIYLILFIFCATLSAQERPPILNFLPEDYNAQNQNWAVSQSQDKIIYVANNSGLLEYNGARWLLYPSPNQTIIRSVNVINGLVYTGAYMEFGYWEKDNFGKLNYTSLSQNIQKNLVEDEQFWNIIALDENWVLFQSLNRIYSYNLRSNTFKIIESTSTISKTYKVNGSIFFQELNHGIYKIVNGKKELVTDDLISKNDIIVNLFASGNRLLALTQNNGFFEIINGKLQELKITSNALVKNKSIYSAIQLKDKSYVLGTISDGILHINEQGDLLMTIKKNGLLNNTVLSLFEDKQNNLWLGLDNGLSCINMQSPFKVYHDYEGVLGSIYTSAIYNDKIYLGTNEGLFYKNINSQDDFQFISGTQGQVWSLVEYDNTLFCCHNAGTFIVDGNVATKIPKTQGSWDIKSLDNKNLLLQGNYDGLYVLEKNENQWNVRNKIQDFNISSRNFEELSNNKIFVNHEYKGIYKIEVDNNFSKTLNVTIDSISKGAHSSILKYNGNLLYAYNDGIFKYFETNNSFEIDSVLSKAYSKEDYVSGKLVSADNGEILWNFSNSSINYFTKGKLSTIPKINRIPLNQSFRKSIVGYENVLHLNDQKYLFGGISEYVTIDLSKLKQEDFDVRINYIAKRKGKNSLDFEMLDSKVLGEFKSNENHIEFAFNVPEYNKYFETNYQYQLEGIYNGWSNWSTKSEEIFENLPHGDYTFNVRAKNGNKLSKNVASYSFNIDKPWYISNLMLILYALGVLLFFISMHHTYKRYYKKEKKKLIEKTERILKLTKSEKEKQIINLKNEQLELENKSKGRELAASTMSIIKKNQLLATIKDELKLLKDKDTMQDVIKVIDKSLNKTDDWEFFQEAFNNADKDFLQKVKHAYPDLTPNDLRLCAYLRLNLSSKEIAPLLNISHKSVEIKRYRLRKKMNLDSSDNLVTRILEI
jgi:DNA-binding CsgD family transcriptional regulator